MIDYNVRPKTPVALEAVIKHGATMALLQQRGVEVLLCCSNAKCSCWNAERRWQRWFRLGEDLELRPVAPKPSTPVSQVEHELAIAEPFN